MGVILQKLRGIVDIFAALFHGKFAVFLHRVSMLLPDRLFKFNRGIIFVSPLPRIPTRDSSRFVIGRAEAHDLAEISRFTGVSLAALKKRVNGDNWACISRDTENGNRIVTVQWIHIGPCFIRGYGLLLDRGTKAAYLYGALSDPAVRFTGVFNSAFKSVIEQLRTAGVEEYVGLVEFFNATAYNYHTRSNFTDIATVTYVSICGIKFSTWRNADTGQRRLRTYIRQPQDLSII